MWPSELAVAESVASLAVRTGVDWFLSDDAILGRSEPRQMPLVPSVAGFAPIWGAKAPTVVKTAIHARSRARAADSLPT